MIVIDVTNDPNVVDDKSIHYTAPPFLDMPTPSPVFSFSFMNSSRSSVNSPGPYMPLHWETLCTKRIIHLIAASPICNTSVPTPSTIAVKDTSPLRLTLILPSTLHVPVTTHCSLHIFSLNIICTLRLLQLDNSQLTAHCYCCTGIVHSFSLEPPPWCYLCK